MRAAYYGLKCTREKVRAIFLPLSLSLSLCTHSRTHTLAHLPSIFRIGKVGQLHVSYASTFVPTHTHTHTHVYLFWTYVHSVYMEYTCSTQSHTCSTAHFMLVPAHIALLFLLFLLPLHPSSLSLSLSLVSVIPTRFLAISHYRTRFVCFVSFLLVCYEK